MAGWAIHADGQEQLGAARWVRLRSRMSRLPRVRSFGTDVRFADAESVVFLNIAARTRIRLQDRAAVETIGAVIVVDAVASAVRRAALVRDAGQKIAFEVWVSTNGILDAVVGLFRDRNLGGVGAVDDRAAATDVVFGAAGQHADGEAHDHQHAACEMPPVLVSIDRWCCLHRLQSASCCASAITRRIGVGNCGSIGLICRMLHRSIRCPQRGMDTHDG